MTHATYRECFDSLVETRAKIETVTDSPDLRLRVLASAVQTQNEILRRLLELVALDQADRT